MARAFKRPKKPTGSPKKFIDWEIVDKYLRAGCNGVEIAPHFGMCADTLYLRCEEEKGMTFTAYSAQKKAQGDSLLREKQMSKALEGSDTMLIWLGKCRLDQKETQNIITATPEHNAMFNAIMNQFQSAQSRNKDDTITRD